MWIVRDRKGILYLYENKPTKINELWISYGGSRMKLFLGYPCFSDVKYEDEEPKEVILKVVENHESNIS